MESDEPVVVKVVGSEAEADIVCVVTSHSTVDYGRVAERAPLVIDFRNVVPRGRDNVVRL